MQESPLPGGAEVRACAKVECARAARASARVSSHQAGLPVCARRAVRMQAARPRTCVQPHGRATGRRRGSAHTGIVVPVVLTSGTGPRGHDVRTVRESFLARRRKRGYKNAIYKAQRPRILLRIVLSAPVLHST